MMRACVFGSAHGLRRRFLRLDSALCLSLSPLVFNAAVGPPALKFLPVCLCVCMCALLLFFHGGDGRRREPDVLQAGRTQIWNRVLCPGGFWRLRIVSDRDSRPCLKTLCVLLE